MSHVFISYSRRDTETVDKVVERLEKAGIKVWIDREGIRAGRQWRLQIVEAIDTANAFVLHVSEASVASVNVLKELNLAEDAAEPFVLPFLLEEVKLPAEMRYQLAGVQQIFYYRDPEKAYKELEATLQERMGSKREENPAETREIEIVVNGETIADFDEDKKQQLLALLAESTGVPVEKLAITRIELGSIHVFIDVPRQVGYALKALALNKDEKLIEGGVKSLRFTGDKHFISLKDVSKLPSQIKKKRSKLFSWGLAGLLLIALALASVFLPSSIDSEPTQTSTPTSTRTHLPADTKTPSLAPTLTSTPTITLTPTETPLPTPVVNFWVEPAEVIAGNCAVFRWEVENAQKVVFGSVEMDFTGRYSDCFCKTNVYTLTVIDLFEQESKHRQTITVIGACGSSSGTGSGSETASPEPTPIPIPTSTSTPKIIPG